ncbi:MAG: hypothetical protein EPO64_04980, partial [Nitrospirae bacterium]
MIPITGREPRVGEGIRQSCSVGQAGAVPARAILGILMLYAVTVSCEDMRADRAYVHGDYEAAVKELRDLAEHGEARAQYDLGLLYDTGQGVAHAPDARAYLAGRMTTEQIARGQELIRAYMERKKTQ